MTRQRITVLGATGSIGTSTLDVVARHPEQKDFSFEEFMRQQNLPYEQLAAMSGVFGSNLGGTSVTKSDSGGGK